MDLQPCLIRPGLYLSSLQTEVYRDILDEHGITHILQVSVATVAFVDGLYGSPVWAVSDTWTKAYKHIVEDWRMAFVQVPPRCSYQLLEEVM